MFISNLVHVLLRATGKAGNRKRDGIVNCTLTAAKWRHVYILSTEITSVHGWNRGVSFSPVSFIFSTPATKHPVS